MRRFIDEPDRFRREFQTVNEFLGEDLPGETPTYGLSGAVYMSRLLDDAATVLDGVDPAVAGSDPALPRGWERLGSMELAEKTCALADALLIERAEGYGGPFAQTTGPGDDGVGRSGEQSASISMEQVLKDIDDGVAF
jgi:hypothetical protein